MSGASISSLCVCVFWEGDFLSRRGRELAAVRVGIKGHPCPVIPKIAIHGDFSLGCVLLLRKSSFQNRANTQRGYADAGLTLFRGDVKKGGVVFWGLVIWPIFFIGKFV